MKKKNVLNAVLWGAIMIVVQVAVDLIRHTPINWIEVLIGGIIVFLICIGSKKNPTVEIKNPEQPAKLPDTDDKNKADSVKDEAKDNSRADNLNTNMGDLRFYTYNRIAIIGLVAGVGCLAYARMAPAGNVFWLYLVSALCFIQAIVFFALYSKKRDEFVKKEQEQRNGN